MYITPYTLNVYNSGGDKTLPKIMTLPSLFFFFVKIKLVQENIFEENT
jgi:hypothetical protein